MASPATSTYLPALEVPHEREGVGQELQATLLELLDLSLIGKQLHWTVVGPLLGPSTCSSTSSSNPGASFLTPLPNGPSLSGSSPMGRRRPSRPSRSLPRWRATRSKITLLCAI